MTIIVLVYQKHFHYTYCLIPLFHSKQFHWTKFLRYISHSDIVELCNFYCPLEWTYREMLEEKEENNADVNVTPTYDRSILWSNLLSNLFRY